MRRPAFACFRARFVPRTKLRAEVGQVGPSTRAPGGGGESSSSTLQTRRHGCGDGRGVCRLCRFWVPRRRAGAMTGRVGVSALSVLGTGGHLGAVTAEGVCRPFDQAQDRPCRSLKSGGKALAGDAAWAGGWQMQSYMYPTIVSRRRELGRRGCGRGGGDCFGAFSALSP
jgi:hypothetical protein